MHPLHGVIITSVHNANNWTFLENDVRNKAHSLLFLGANNKTRLFSIMFKVVEFVFLLNTIVSAWPCALTPTSWHAGVCKEKNFNVTNKDSLSAVWLLSINGLHRRKYVGDYWIQLVQIEFIRLLAYSLIGLKAYYSMPIENLIGKVVAMRVKKYLDLGD